jgi:two-component system chemotaxis sensor kinase CheA
VELVVNGEELSVDNIVTKLFKNTLIHLLRNSLDHGVETPSVRVEAGKNPVGKLTITILEDGEDIVLKIEDDGYGIDPEIIKKVAIKKNLHSIEKLEQMSDLEIVNIVFDSGFSTAKKVSDLSGRGVGMDMVRGSFEEMGGSVHLNSKICEGSIFTLKVPVPKSVLIVNTLSVKVADESFIFHMDEVAEVIRYESESANSKMYTIDGNLLLNHNNTMIQLIHLSDVFEYEKRSKVEDVFNVVVLRVGASRFGIIVDEIFDFEEVVSRQISDQVKSNSLFHGASLVGSGEVAMIISAEGIANEVNINLNSEKKSQLLEDPLNEQSEDIEIDEYMLFKYESNEYLCINLDDVERLEKIEPSKFEKVGDNFIIRYLDSSLPIIEPASHIGLRPFNMDHVLKEKEDDFIEIIVVSVEGKKLGLLVHELDEIQVSNEAMNTDTIINVGLKGSVYINGKTICVLDLKYLQREFKNNKSLIDFRVGQVVESDNVA